MVGDAKIDGPSPRSGWAVLNSPIVIAMLTSGLLAGLGANYNNFLSERARSEARREEMLALSSELRVRASRLEAIDVALLHVDDQKKRDILGASVRQVIEGADSGRGGDGKYRHDHMRALVDIASVEAGHSPDHQLQGDLQILDSSDAIASAELRRRLPRIRNFARSSYVYWAYSDR